VTLYKEKPSLKEKVNPITNIIYFPLYLINGERENEYTVSLKDKFITDMQIGVTKTGDIIAEVFILRRKPIVLKLLFT